MDLYSRAARIIRDLPQQKGTAEQLKAMALKVGAKPVEFEHARFDKKFSGPTTKDELAQHLEQSMPQITETVYGATPKMKLAENRLFEIHPEIEAIDEALRALLVGGEVPEEFGGAEANQNELEQRYYELVNEREKLYEQATRKNPRFADYQTPGGDNYREVLLQLNGNLEGAITVGAYKSAIRQALIDDMGNEAEADAYLRAKKDRHVEHMPVHIIKQAREKLGFQEDNHQRVASNIRFGDANNDDAVMFALQHTNSHWPEKDVLAHIRMKDRVDEATGQKVLHVEELQSDWAQEARQKGFSEVPYHPLIADTGAWLELALKRIGQEAAQGGYDKVIFTPGQEQADRYSLEKQVRSVSWSPDTQYLTAKTIPGGELFNQTVPKDKLPQYVGKELAERLLATEPKMYPGENVAYHSLIGDDLRVGGTGMKTFYDNVVPKTANKLFGKQGARIEPFGHTEQDGSQYHVMNVTPEMKQQYAGAVPAFAQGGEVEERVIPPGHPERRENLADWNKGNKLVDEQGNPLTLYRGAVGHKELPEGFLQGKTRSNYATFTSTSPSLASTYANVDRSSDPDAVGGVMPIHAHAHVLHEFPTKGPSFDKFAFDKFARSLPKGHAVVARQVLDIGPRASNATDPEKRYSYPSDIYAWNEANSVKSAIGNRGTFDPNDPDITKAEGGSVIPPGHPEREENFRQWFGKSTAIDGEGKPWPHYHITSGDFSTFIPGGPNPEMSGPAIWLTPNKKMQPAAHNTMLRGGEFKPGANVMPMYVKIENPIFADEEDREGMNELRERFGSKSPGWPMYLHPDDVQKMKDAGYDGIYHQKWRKGEKFDPNTGEGLETIVFHPSQLKSATGNQGTFDPENPDITKAGGGEVDDRYFSPVPGVEAYHEDPAFKEWFGNSVTHREGVPVTYYTGTSKDTDFNKFNVGRHGSWFTADPFEASGYALVNDSQGHRYEGQRFIPTNTASRVIPAHLKIENPYTGPLPAWTYSENYKKSQSDFFDALRAKGYDGWIPADQGGKLAVVLKEPHQIKTVNNRTWDAKNPRMDKAQGGEAVGKAIGGGTFEGKKVPDAKRLARVADKFIYHSGIADQLPDMKWGLEPQHGDWVREVASSTGLDEDELLDRSVPLVWMSDDPSWVGMKVARKLGKHPHNVTRDDIREHGHVAMIPRKGDHAEHVWYVGDRGLDNGEYSTVTNLNGKTAKAYETDLYDHDDMSGRKEPFGVERNEYVSARPVEPMFHLTGDDLVDFLDATSHIPAKATGGEVEDEGITAYHGSPHDYPAERLVQYGDGRTEYLVGSPNALPDVPEGATSLQEFPLGRMRLDKIGTGEGAQAYGHGLYTAEAEPIARHYRDALTKGAWNMTIDGQPFTQFYQSTDPEKALKAKIALAVREGRDINQAIDWVEQQTYGKLSSRRLMPEDQPVLMDDLARLKKFRRELPDIQQNLGHMYEVRINAHPDHFLDWDKPLSEQSEHVRKALTSLAKGDDALMDRIMAVHKNGSKADIAYGSLTEHFVRNKKYEQMRSGMPEKEATPSLEYGQRLTSDALASVGIKGIRYLDASSRGAGEGSRNYVVFDDKLVNVKRKYADGGEV